MTEDYDHFMEDFEGFLEDLEEITESMGRTPDDFERELEDRGYEILDRADGEAITYRIGDPDSEEYENVGLSYDREGRLQVVSIRKLVGSTMSNDGPVSRWGSF